MKKTSLLQQISDFALSKVGCGYVWGANGFVCSEKKRKELAEKYPEQADNILNVCQKWDGVQCYDCAQLTRYAAQAGGASLPSGATSQWNNAASWETKGEIAAMPDQAGVILYRKSGNKMQHTGVYVGNGQVVDSRGSSKGVIKSALSSYAWTHWALPKTAEGGQTLDEPILHYATVTKTAGATGSTVNIRATPQGEKLGRVPFGETLPIYDKKDGWSRTNYGILRGWMDAKFLVRCGENDEKGENDEDDDKNDENTLQVPRVQLEAMYNALGELLGGVANEQ